MASSPRSKRAFPFNVQEIKQQDSCKKIKEEYPTNEEASEKNAQSSHEEVLNKSDKDFEFNDDSLNRKCLISCFPFLSNNLSVPEVVIYLRANNILTPHQADLINAKETRLDKTEILINTVMQRGPKAFCCFLKSLTETGHKYLFDKLIEERKTIAERENLRKLAEEGNADAQFNLGMMYQKGNGVPQSDEESVKWYRKSAEQGNAVAQLNLGVRYENGRGVPKSYEQAAKWYGKSATQGLEVAQFVLGWMYKNGRGLPQSDEEAVKWYRKSAEQGYAAAQHELKEMSKDGHGILNY